MAPKATTDPITAVVMMTDIASTRNAAWIGTYRFVSIELKLTKEHGSRRKVNISDFPISENLATGVYVLWTC